DPASPTAFVTRGTTARSGPSAPRGRVLWSLRRGVHLFEVAPVLLVQRAQVGLDHRFVVAPQRGVVEVRTSGEYPAGVVVTVDLTLDDEVLRVDAAGQRVRVVERTHRDVRVSCQRLGHLLVHEPPHDADP